MGRESAGEWECSDHGPDGCARGDAAGDAVWSFNPSDAPGYKFASLQQAWRLPNGNTLVNNWVNEWSKSGPAGPGTVQAIELTPAKEVVWALREWTPPTNLGPATTIQVLDEPSAPEEVHFASDLPDPGTMRSLSTLKAPGVELACMPAMVLS